MARPQVPHQWLKEICPGTTQGSSRITHVQQYAERRGALPSPSPMTGKARVHGGVHAHDVQDVETQAVVEAERLPAITTTLFDLIAALQAVVEPEGDAWVVATVVHWLRSGRMRLPERGPVCLYNAP